MPGFSPMAVNAAACGLTPDEVQGAMFARAGMIAGIDNKPILRSKSDFEACLMSITDRGLESVQTSISNLSKVFGAVLTAKSLVDSKHPVAWKNTLDDLGAQLKVLTRGDYVLSTPTQWLWCIPRYIRAMEIRLSRMRSSGPQKDEQMLRSVTQWVRCIEELRSQGADSDDAVAEAYEELFWMVQEYRVAVFAQELKTLVPVSDKRLRTQLAKITG